MLEDNYRGNVNYIRVSDFNSLNKTNYQEINLYNSNGEKNYYTDFEAKIISPTEIRIRDLDSYNYNNKGITYELIKDRKQKTEIETQRPHKAIIKEWDKTVSNLLKQIDKTIKEIENFKKEDLASLKENIFVNKKLASLAEHNLNQTINRFIAEKIRVEKLKEKYDAL
jgi:phenylalanyl-tRNA synthetase alpha subunit